MSLNTAAVTSDYEVLRRSREARPRSPWRRWFTRHRVEWAVRWVFGIAPLAVTVGIIEYAFLGHDHGWRGNSQCIAALAYAACVSWSILGSPSVATRGRRTGLLLTGIAMGVCVGTIGPAIGITPTLAEQSPGVILVALLGSPLDAFMLVLLLIWMAGPVSIAVLSAADALRSLRVRWSRGFGWTDPGWILCGIFAGLSSATFAAVWPTAASS